MELVFVAEFELIGFGHDQPLIPVFENSLLLQSIGASPAAHSTRSEAQTDQIPVQLCLPNGLRYAADHMTFIIEAVKDDRYTTDIR